MVQSKARLALCALVGIFAGLAVGPVFAPDPTGLGVVLLTIAVAVVTSGYLYQSSFLKDTESVA
jgi:hypothetical protein